jgi:gamma-glutamylaminecyclotransferase
VDGFVYGTLTDRETATTVLDDFEYRGPAVLDGLDRVDGRYPTLAPGGRVEGRLLSTPEVDALDRYEGVDDGLYVRLPVPCADNETVQTYVGAPERLGVPDEWPGAGVFGERVRRYVDEHAVVVRKIDR